jgi:conflict system STAND superfamily ATPase/GAF domain-containing protein
MIKKALSLTLILIGMALLITAIVFWVDSINSSAPQTFDQSLRDWITLLAGLGSSIKGWIDLTKKESSLPSPQSNTNGGIIVRGNVEKVGKDIIGRDQVITTSVVSDNRDYTIRDVGKDMIGRDQIVTTNIVTHDNVYNVEGLPNPYLGLKAFTYNERDKYAGRERLTEDALQLLISSERQTNLMFVTGASGSGKSSFVQASLLPAIINQFQQNGEIVKFEVFRPSQSPKRRLNEALKRVGSKDIQVIVIDQFEELFTQSIPNERDALFGFLRKLPPSNKSQRFVIATLRSDYLGELFDVQWLWEIAKQGIELREMRIQELKDAILRPLQARYPNGDKKFDSKLVEKLAMDTAESVTFLPLLQITLEEVWNKGQLRLGAYNHLTDAIKDRADTVLTYRDFDKALPNSRRTEAEREEVLEVLLDLVNPSLDNNQNHDVRISRKLSDFNSRQKMLIRELSSARLISIEVEDKVEIVNLIHEALIQSWDLLSKGINQKRIQLQKRVRFEEQMRVWIAKNKANDFLLSKGQYAEALELDQDKDISLCTKDAQEFLKSSEKQIERETKHEEILATMEQQVEVMNALANLSAALTSTLNFDDVMELMFTATAQMIPLSHFHITLYNNSTKYFYYSFCLENNERITERENQPHSMKVGISPEVIRKSRLIITEDYIRECQDRNLTPEIQNVIAWIGVPLVAGRDTIGSISIGSQDSSIIYTQAQANLLQAIADRAGIAMSNAQKYEEALKHSDDRTFKNKKN